MSRNPRHRFANQGDTPGSHPASTKAPKRTLDQQFAEHQAQRPEMPRGLGPDDSAFVEWYQAFTRWAATKSRLQARLKTRGLRFDHWGRQVRTTGGEE